MQEVLLEIASAKGEDPQMLGSGSLEDRFIFWLNFVIDSASQVQFPSHNVVKVIKLAAEKLVDGKPMVTEVINKMLEIIDYAEKNNYDPLFPNTWTTSSSSSASS